MKQALKAWLNRHPRLKRFARALMARGPASVSSDYVVVDDDAVDGVARELAGAWKNSSLPARQRKLADSQLRAYRAGMAVPVFDALVEPLRRLAPAPGSSLLEVGCSSGYYAEVLAARGLKLQYSGCDYSPAFIDLARQCYPALRFDVMDATRLDYEASQFDIVVSGSCLLHIPDYPKAIAETARVARSHAIFHRTPVFGSGPTRHFTKLAYGIKTLEIRFSEAELAGLFAQHGLQTVETVTIDADVQDGETVAVKTYVCRKVRA